jgi:nucleotide-binding universal stress UspA family protein
MQNIVVGVDGSAVGRDALRWAVGVAVKSDAQIHAVNCFHDPYSEVTPENHDRLLAERESELAGRWTAIAHDAGVTLTTEVRPGDPRDVFARVTAADDVDLLVLGRTGAGGGPGFLHVGSVVEHVAHHLSVPLAVISPGASETIDRVVVGVDGSDASFAAVEWTADFAASVDASVIAVNVAEPFLEWTPADSPDNWRRDAERRINEWTAPLTDAGVTARAVAHRDLYPADGLLGVSATRHGDLLVVGTRGVGGFSGLRTGGVAIKILHRANLPLVLVPAE